MVTVTAAGPPERPSVIVSGILILPESRALIRQVGSQAWAVLEDVSLDASPEDGRWVARTSVRGVAAHRGLTPGTVARALAKLCAAGLVVREDHRHPENRVGSRRRATS